MYYIYMLRCIDDTIYTGITTDIERRMLEHFSRDEKCAKYTKRHKAKKLEAVWETETRAKASKLEYHIKTLSKDKKERLIKEKNIEEVLANKIEANEYQVYKNK